VIRAKRNIKYKI